MQEKREKNDYIINEKMREQRGCDIMVGASISRPVTKVLPTREEDVYI